MIHFLDFTRTISSEVNKTAIKKWCCIYSSTI